MESHPSGCLCGMKRNTLGSHSFRLAAAFGYRPPVRPMSARSFETVFLRPSFSVTHSAPLGVDTFIDRVPRL